MPIQFTPRKPAPSMSPPITEKLAVSKKEASQLLSISERHLDNLVKQGKIVARKSGVRVLFPMESLRNYLNATTSTNPSE